MLRRPAIGARLTDPAVDPAIGTRSRHLLAVEFAFDVCGVEPTDRVRVDEVEREVRLDVRVVVDRPALELDRENALLVVVADRVDVGARNREGWDLVNRLVGHRSPSRMRVNGRAVVVNKTEPAPRRRHTGRPAPAVFSLRTVRVELCSFSDYERELLPVLPELFPDLVAEPPILRAAWVRPARLSDAARTIARERPLLANP